MPAFFSVFPRSLDMYAPFWNSPITTGPMKEGICLCVNTYVYVCICMYVCMLGHVRAVLEFSHYYRACGRRYLFLMNMYVCICF